MILRRLLLVFWTALVLAALLCVTATNPASAGQDVFFQLHNGLSKSEPLYPRLRLQTTDNLCWYPQDLADGPTAPAGGGYANYTSEVNNQFFSFCNPSFNPLGSRTLRWVMFQVQSQARPGAPWVPVTWPDEGKQASHLLVTYARWLTDVTFSLSLGAPTPNQVLATPAGKACLRYTPILPMMNYSMRVDFDVLPLSADGTCPKSATTAERAADGLRQPTIPTQKRVIALRTGRERTVVVGQVRARTTKARWQIRGANCTSAHFDAGPVKPHTGPGGTSWDAITLRGTTAGTDRCTVDLIGPGGRTLLRQKVSVRVR